MSVHLKTSIPAPTLPPLVTMFVFLNCESAETGFLKWAREPLKWTSWPASLPDEPELILLLKTEGICASQSWKTIKGMSARGGFLEPQLPSQRKDDDHLSPGGKPRVCPASKGAWTSDPKMTPSRVAQEEMLGCNAPVKDSQIIFSSIIKALDIPPLCKQLLWYLNVGNTLSVFF